MRDFNPNIANAFQLKVNKVKRIWGCYLCETNKGLKLIKEKNISYPKMLFVHSAKEYLYKRGFKNIDRFSETKDKHPYYEYNKTMYVLKDWIDGEECNMSDLSQSSYAIEKLAELHNASEGFRPFRESMIVDQTGQIPLKIEKHYREFLRVYKYIKKQSRWSDFDILFIKNYKKFLNDAFRSNELIKTINYERIINKAKKEKVLCHNKYINHNIIINKKDIMIVNFDNCGYKTTVSDLVQFLRKTMEKCDWNIDIGFKLIKIYTNKKQLSQEEKQLLFSMLLFPEKFWKLCNQYYNSRRALLPKISESKLEKIINQKELKDKFIVELSKELNLSNDF